MKDNESKLEVFEDEKSLLLDHDYDGIKELDNPLPKWWLVTFYLTIIFAVPYYLSHTFWGATTINEELEQDMKIVTAKQIEFEKKSGGFILDEYKKVKENPKTAKLARKLFKRKCKACHGKKGEGSVGPNLTDAYWIHGNGSLEAVYKIIDKGVVEKGMPEWGTTLGKKKVLAVLSYVEKLIGTNVEGKAPQGKKVE